MGVSGRRTELTAGGSENINPSPPIASLCRIRTVDLDWIRLGGGLHSPSALVCIYLFWMLPLRVMNIRIIGCQRATQRSC